MSRGAAAKRAGKTRQPSAILAAGRARESAWQTAQTCQGSLALEQALATAIGAVAAIEHGLQTYRSRGRNRRDDRQTLLTQSYSQEMPSQLPDTTRFTSLGETVIATLARSPLA